MSSMQAKLSGDNSLPLFRGKESVANLFSALGGLKETRLTAALGFLLSKAPGAFGPLFLNREVTIEEINIEEAQDSNRYDLLIRTPRKLVVVEAKVGFTQAPAQVVRYVRKLRQSNPDKALTLYLLDRGSDPIQTELAYLKRQFPRCTVKQKTWDDLARFVENVCRSRKLQKSQPVAVMIGRELVEHLREEHMAQSQSKEVYIRQLSGPSLELFFRHHLYKCQGKFAKNALQHSYFAPLFTSKAPRDFSGSSMIPIEKGLCYISRITQGKVVRRSEVLQYLKKVGHPEYKAAAKMVLKQSSEKEVLVLILGSIFRAFETPIPPSKLDVKGMLSQKTATFEELFSASRGGI